MKYFLDKREKKDFVKSTNACVFPLLSASVASQKGLIDPYEIVQYCGLYKESSEPAYEINELTGGGHGETTKSMCNWLSRGLQHLRGDSMSIQTECELGPDIQSNPLWISPRKRADIVIKNNRKVILQFEVQSNKKRIPTIKKLGYGLCDQHRYFLNRNVSVNNVIGFYIPVVEGHVEMVTCTWKDDDLCYEIATKKLPKDQVLNEIESAYRNQLALQPSNPTNIKMLTLPLREEYVLEHFGEGAYQIQTGASIVVYSPCRNKVYKYPLSHRKSENLKTLINKCNISYTSLPQSEELVGECFFYVFNALQLPISRKDAKIIFFPFVEQIVRALTELHQNKIAHLDIRLENICFSDNGEAILIDLDRSDKVTKPAEQITDYGKSNMYTHEEGWTAKNLDWRQLAILLHYILLPDEEVASKRFDYHEVDASSSSHEYISKMYREGIYH